MYYGMTYTDGDTAELVIYDTDCTCIARLKTTREFLPIFVESIAVSTAFIQNVLVVDDPALARAISGRGVFVFQTFNSYQTLPSDKGARLCEHD